METKHARTDNRWMRLLLLAMLLLSMVPTGADGGRRGRGGGGGRRRNKRGSLKCSGSSVAEFKLTFHGLWSEDVFPRMYPRHRPQAHWSKLLGRSHDASYQMWRLGQEADPAVKKFAEQGVSTLYDHQPQGYGGLFDTFYAEPITGGEGWTSTFFLADGLHSRMSFMVKLVPSPDWFVGVDSLDLCRRGRWRSSAHVNLRPVDGGTDRGYTFTSPNWPSLPPEPVYQITSSFPDHPASAFLYSQYERLPRMAYVEVERVAQYFRKRDVSPLKSNRTVNVKVFRDKAASSTDASVLNTALAVQDQIVATHVPNDFAKAMDEAGNSNRNPSSDLAAANSLHRQLNQQQFPVTTTHESAEATQQSKKADMKRREVYSAVRRSPVSLPTTTPTERTPDVSDRQRQSQMRSGSLAGFRSNANPRKPPSTEAPSSTEPADSQSQHSFDEPQFPEVSKDGFLVDGPADCLVGEWLDWSPCSKTCGFGLRVRTRGIVSHSRLTGRACPILQQEVLCGSMRTCKWNHFSFLADRKPSGQSRRRRRRQHDDQDHHHGR